MWTFNNQIVEIMVKVNLFKNKLNSENLANHILSTLEEYDLDVRNWVGTQMGHVSTREGCPIC